MMSQRQAIDELINSDNTDSHDKNALKEVLQIRNFASSDLLLPDNNSYTSYVELDRDYVTWAVFAAGSLTLTPKTWCFLVVGCVPYRGYFSHAKARHFTLQLQTQGYDTYIAPVPAYSTLGWFSDPVLSSMLGRGSIVTAEYIFHELAHQKLYIKNDTAFNEAFATAVGQIGVEKWLISKGMDKSLNNYLEANKNKLEIYQIIDSLKKQLQEIYESSSGNEHKLALKNMALDKYRETMTKQLITWNKLQQYRSWLLDDMNNAKLNAFSTYRELVPLFLDLYQRCNQEMVRFYQAIDGMRVLEKNLRIKHLQSTQC